jgi:hypothetical protein
MGISVAAPNMDEKIAGHLPDAFENAKGHRL